MNVIDRIERGLSDARDAQQVFCLTAAVLRAIAHLPREYHDVRIDLTSALACVLEERDDGS